MSARTVALVLTAQTGAEQSATALALAERLLARGNRVTVFAHDAAAAMSAGEGEVAAAVGALVRQGVHGGTLDWVVDGAAMRRRGVEGAQVPGVVPGDHADLWSFVREADLTLATPREEGR